MSRARNITVKSAAPPDLDAAAGAMLPLFLAFLDWRVKHPAEASPVEPARANEESRQLPP
jgi:hypothetical protein